MGQGASGISALMDRTATTLRERGVSAESLAEVAEELKKFAAKLVLPRSDFPVAKPGEEVVYPLAVDPRSGFALYLVSDAPGTKSPPHDHQTWSVIVGIEGRERNQLYKVTDPQERRVERLSEVVIRKGEALVLREGEIHSTEAVGPAPTYHLHLYGRSLNTLPTLRERTFVCAPELD